MKLRLAAVLAMICALAGLVHLFKKRPPSDPPPVPVAVVTPAATAPAITPAVPPAPVVPVPPPAALPTPELIVSPVAAGQPMTRTITKPLVPTPASVRVAPVVPEAQGLAELENVQFMLRDFRSRFQENPVGSNAEIMRAVMGGNEAQARLGPPPGQQLNADGELTDPWGTAYFFHQLSATQMEVRSAGPDKTLWTADDLVGK
jgi:hypothetical protein